MTIAKTYRAELLEKSNERGQIGFSVR